jgi:hypothetical protein
MSETQAPAAGKKKTTAGPKVPRGMKFPKGNEAKVNLVIDLVGRCGKILGKLDMENGFEFLKETEDVKQELLASSEKLLGLVKK